MFVKDFYSFCVTATGQKRVRRHFLNEFNEFNMRVSHYENKWTSLDRKPTAEANNRIKPKVCWNVVEILEHAQAHGFW